MSMHIATCGQTTKSLIDPSILPSITQPSYIQYWFDDDIKSLKQIDNFQGKQILDVSTLFYGIHTIHVQIVDSKGVICAPDSRLFMNLKADGSAANKLRYWFDDNTNETHDVAASSGTLTLDASALIDGVHTLNYQVVSNDGTIGATESSLFMRVSEGLLGAKVETLRYWFDGDAKTVREEDFNGGIKMLDVSDLNMGIHTLNFQLRDGTGSMSAPSSSIFLKMLNVPTPDGNNAIVKYMYWVNDNSVNNEKVNVDEPSSSYTLTALLPMPESPIRSSCFHFEMTDGVPTMYAKNEFHIRFYDAIGYWTDESRTFIDYAVAQEIKDVKNLLATQTFTRPDNNEIKWFKFEAAPGDTIGFRSSQATSLQVFAPSGKEILSTMGDKSVKYGGTHTWEEGTYYVAVHDVTGSKPNVTIDYMHMDKYDVVSQDVHVVGNGGCSTITFQGNGFKDLYAVDLKDSKGNIIESIDVGHESDATTTVTFDFTGAKLGKYNALFHFTEEDKTVTNCINVEEAKDIELATTVSYPSTFLRGTSVTYTVEITNKGNMTAYAVPLYSYIQAPSEDVISKIEIDGLNLSFLYDYFVIDSMPSSLKAELKAYSDELADKHYFMCLKSFDNDSGDSVCVWSNIFFAEIAPNSKKTISFTINSSDIVQASFTIPDDWNSLVRNSTIPLNAKRLARRNSLKDQYCCIKERVECVGNITVNVLDVLSTAIPGNVNLALADCVAGLVNQTISAVGTLACDDNNQRYDTDFASRVRRVAGGISIAGAVSSCLHFIDVPKVGDFVNLCNALTHPLTTYDCIKSFATEKPGCPPTPPKGGTSTPRNSCEPNDIRGYTSESGSTFMRDDVEEVTYIIDSENDPVFADAPAHTVIITDTINGKFYDLESLSTRNVTIGDVSMDLDGTEQNFIKTMDLRPRINVIAQVEQKYDPKTGIAKWIWTSLDPMTMEPTTEVMQGVLPVNDETHIGEGHITYRLKQKAGLPDGTEVTNQADIIFDSNEPVFTPVWTNIIDAIPPVTHVSDVEQVNDTIVRVHFDGEDNRSGVWKYALYVQYGENTAWNEVAELDTTCCDFRFYKDIDYGFCVVATDSAGNVEKKIIQREYKFINGEGEMIDGISSPKADQVATNRAYDLSGRLIQEEGYRGITIKNRKKWLKRQ